MGVASSEDFISVHMVSNNCWLLLGSFLGEEFWPTTWPGIFLDCGCSKEHVMVLTSSNCSEIWILQSLELTLSTTEGNFKKQLPRWCTFHRWKKQNAKWACLLLVTYDKLEKYGTFHWPPDFWNTVISGTKDSPCKRLITTWELM